MLVTSFLTRDFYHCKRTSDSSWYLIGYLVQHGQSKHMYDKSAIFTLWCMLSSIVAYFTYLRLDSDKFQRDSHGENAREDKTKCRTEYTIEWHVLKKSAKSNFHTFCEACKCEVSVQYGPYGRVRGNGWLPLTREFNEAPERRSAISRTDLDVPTFFLD